MVDATPSHPSPTRLSAPPALDATTFPPLQRALALALEPEGAQVVIDLNQTRYASPGALLMLRRSAREATRCGRSLTLLRTPPTIRAAFEALELRGETDASKGAVFPEKRTRG